MSSHTPYDTARPRRSAILTATEELYIDWGPDLPARYPGGRARVMVANPTTLYVSWESDQPSPDRWYLEVRIDGAASESLEVPGKGSDAWFQVPARTTGAVHLVRVGAGHRSEVAVLPFSTPPAGPSDALEERWGRQAEGGHLVADVAPVRGTRIDDPAGVDAAQRVGYETATDRGSSSTPYRR